MQNESLFGLLLVVAGAVCLVQGLKKNSSSMEGLRLRMILAGAASIFFGLIIMFR